MLLVYTQAPQTNRTPDTAISHDRTIGEAMAARITPVATLMHAVEKNMIVVRPILIPGERAGTAGWGGGGAHTNNQINYNLQLVASHYNTYKESFFSWHLQNSH